MNQKERMLAGLPYKAWLDGLSEERLQAKRRITQFNNCAPDAQEQMQNILGELLGKKGENVYFVQPFCCDYGSNIEIGDNFYAGWNCVILDVGKVTIGNNTMFGPNVTITTAGHPIHPQSRNSGYEYGIEITIGDDVWIGANVVVNPGVHIGNGVVVGSGSVVTKDLPDNVVAAGNPCRVLRQITAQDRDYYFKDRKFDVDDY